MNVLRFRIIWLMVIIAIAALDFGTIRALLGFDSRIANALLVSILPLMNVLAGGVLIAQQRPESRPFLRGFIAFGAMALALCVVLILYDDAKVLEAYVTLSTEPMEIANSYVPYFNNFPYNAFFIAVWVGLPQVTVALIGGFLFRRFSSRINRIPAR